MWQAIERMMNCIFRSVVMCYIYYVYVGNKSAIHKQSELHFYFLI